jgi:hypothetical protein
MAITQLAGAPWTEGTTSPQSLPVLPTGYTTGTLFIMHVISREDNPTPVHNVTTSGVAWTQIGTTRFLDIGTTGIGMSVWYRFATSGSETLPSVSCPTPTTLALLCTGFNGVHPTTPLDGVTPLGGTAAAATTLQPNGGTGITTNSDGAWVLCMVATPDDNTITLGTANGFSASGGLGYSGASYQSATLTDWSSAQGVREVLTAGNVTAPTWSQSANGPDEWAWTLFVLKAETPPPTPRRKNRHIRPRGNFNNMSYY